MNFHNLNKIMDNVNVHNKYLLTTVIARRARQISEMKGRFRLENCEPGEKAISLALADMEAGNVQVKLEHETIAAAIESEHGISGGKTESDEEMAETNDEKEAQSDSDSDK